MLTKQFAGEAAAELWLDCAAAARGARPRAAPVAARRLGARRRARRRALRPAPARRRDRARRAATRTAPPACRRSRCTQAAMSSASARSGAARRSSARDLAWLIASLLLVIAPHALRAPWWLTLLTLCLYGWRMYFALNRAPLPSRWLVLGVAAVAMLGVWIEYRTLFGRQPGILLLMLFSGLKLLETRTHRDARDGRVPRLLPGDHQLPLYADDPDRARDGRGAVPAHRHADRLRRAAARAARQPAHRAACCSRTPRPRRWCCSCCSRACRARCGDCRRTPTPA